MGQARVKPEYGWKWVNLKGGANTFYMEKALFLELKKQRHDSKSSIFARKKGGKSLHLCYGVKNRIIHVKFCQLP